MKALSLWQPWATLVAMEVKKVETRCWPTKYRGELAIHSTAKLPAKFLGRSAQTEPFRDELADVFGVRRDRDDRGGKRVDDILRTLPFGKVVCVVKLLSCEPINQFLRADLSEREQIFGNYEDGRYAWFMEMVEVISEPTTAKGMQGLWTWNPEQKFERDAAAGRGR